MIEMNSGKATQTPGRFLCILVLCVVLLSLTSCDGMPIFGSSKRILFIGNSYTTTAGIPYAFAALAKSGRYNVEIGLGADKGGSFAAYVSSPGVQEVLHASKWDFVVIQEQTQMPANANLRTSKMYPAARELVQQIRATGAIPVFFQTSGNRNGWPENGLPGYENMQLEINQGYSEIAEELKAPVAPVGYAWHLAMRNNPQLNLWVDDRHPNEQGAYLAACIFYATIFRSSPEKLSYISSLPRNLAQDMQRLAAEAVLQNPSQWNL